MYYMIINPASKSGRGAQIWSRLKPVLDEKQIPYTECLSQKAGDVITMVRALCENNLKEENDILKLIVLGGDGTVNETLQGITDFSRVWLGYIPTGSSNDMARDLRFPKDSLDALNRILACKEPTPTDIGVALLENTDAGNTDLASHPDWCKRYFAVSCGIGFDAAVCVEALCSRIKNTLNKIGLGKLTYMGIALKQLIAAKRVSCEITLDNGETITLPRFLLVASMVHQYEGGGFMFCPGADAHDGLLDICTIGNVSKPLILCALPTAFFGKHYMFKGIEKYSARKLVVQSSAPLYVHTDGEVAVKADRVTISCEKDKLQLLW